MRWSFVDGSGGDGIVMAAAACPAAALDSAWIEPVVYAAASASTALYCCLAADSVGGKS